MEIRVVAVAASAVAKNVAVVASSAAEVVAELTSIAAEVVAVGYSAVVGCGRGRGQGANRGGQACGRRRV